MDSYMRSEGKVSPTWQCGVAKPGFFMEPWKKFGPQLILITLLKKYIRVFLGWVVTPC